MLQNLTCFASSIYFDFRSLGKEKGLLSKSKKVKVFTVKKINQL